MFKLIIADDEGRKTVLPFTQERLTIGRQEGNIIRLTEQNVSRNHALLQKQDGKLVLKDLGSYNGSRVNGQFIAGSGVQVSSGDLIQIGDYVLALQDEDAVQEAPPESLGEEYDTDKRFKPSKELLEATPKRETKPQPAQQVSTEHAFPRLVVLNTDYAMHVFPCRFQEISIGRGDENDIVIQHHSLSYVHCKLVHEEGTGRWFVIDMKSTNGVLVNDERYTRALINFGDILEFGVVQLQFVGPHEDIPALASTDRGPKRRTLIAAIVIALLLGGVCVLWWQSEGALEVQRTFKPEAP